jgi:Dolichyl-phosphate-mannose-protein mannosyltransferase
MTLNEALSGVPESAGQRTEPRWLDRQSVIAYLILVVIVTTSVFLVVMHFTRVSIYDEQTHADYAWRISHGELPKAGDLLSQEVLREMACRGLSTGEKIGECVAGTFNPPEEFPGRGEQYNFSHPPLYYLLTGIPSRIISALFDVSFVTVARLFGAVWLSLGLIGVYRLGRELGIDSPAALATAAALGLVPTVTEFSSIVNNDAAALLCGASAGLLGLRVLRGPVKWWVIVALAVAITLTKVIFVVVFGAVVLIWLWGGFRTDAKQRVVRSTGILILATALTYLGWSTFQSQRGVEGYVSPGTGISTRPAESFPLDPIVQNLLDAWPPLMDSMARAVGSPWYELWSALSALLIGAGLLIVLVSSQVRLHTLVAVGASAGLLAVPFAIETYAYLDGWYFPNVTARYGMVMLPLMAILLGLGIRRDIRAPVSLALFGFGAVCTFTSLIALQA